MSDPKEVKKPKTAAEIAASNAKKGPRGPKRETVYILNSDKGFAILVDPGRDEEKDENDKVVRPERAASSKVISTFADMARVKAAYPADKFIVSDLVLSGHLVLGSEHATAVAAAFEEGKASAKK